MGRKPPALAETNSVLLLHSWSSNVCRQHKPANIINASCGHFEEKIHNINPFDILCIFQTLKKIIPYLKQLTLHVDLNNARQSLTIKRSIDYSKLICSSFPFFVSILLTIKLDTSKGFLVFNFKLELDLMCAT